MLSFGVYPAVSLADARKERDDAKKLLAAGSILLNRPNLTTSINGLWPRTGSTLSPDEFLAKINAKAKPRRH
ncbi:Arm DNA-binding domain-containing protein [Phyllobacterium bourgognense]|uniref:Arm DNA-binding domain-containing protein n=1 Tax=Phyllobacterium bourgognense TaxID=314236 RepID=UPI003CCAB476